MSDVEFEENNFPVGRPFQEASPTPVLVSLLFKTGVVKSEKQANYVLIGISVCAIILTIIIIRSSFGGGASNQNVVVPNLDFPLPLPADARRGF